MTEPTKATNPEVGKLARAARWLMRLPSLVLFGIIRGYQIVISPMTGPTCRFYPSCSAYAATALKRHGLFKGLVLGVWRLLRCNPWNLGGVDHVPPRRNNSKTTPDGAEGDT